MKNTTHRTINTGHTEIHACNTCATKLLAHVHSAKAYPAATDMKCELNYDDCDEGGGRLIQPVRYGDTRQKFSSG